MKHTLLSIALLLSLFSLGQENNFQDLPKKILENLDKMGEDDSPNLNEFEASYLKAVFKDELKAYDLTGKKVGFIQNGTKTNKNEYFNEVQDRYNKDMGLIGGSAIYLFSPKGKKESEGYDAAIIYWSKVEPAVDKLIKILVENKD